MTLHENENSITWVNGQHITQVREEDDDDALSRRYGPAAVFWQTGLLNIAIHDAVNEVLKAREEAAWQSHWSETLANAGLQPDAEFNPTAAPFGVAERLLPEWYSIDQDSVEEDIKCVEDELLSDDGDAESGRRWGHRVASEYLYHREGDGHSDPDMYAPGTDEDHGKPGIRPAPSGVPESPETADNCDDGDDSAQSEESVEVYFAREENEDTWGSSHFAALDPFALDTSWQFRPGCPPDPFNIDCDRWERNAEFVAEYMSKDAVEANRMVEDGVEIEGFDLSMLDRRDKHIRDVGAFWRGSGGSARPPGFWPIIARELILESPGQLLPDGGWDSHGVSLDSELQTFASTARLYGWLGIALADAGISTWDSKHVYGFWRPRSAIKDLRNDPEFETFAKGGSPEYESGQAKFAGAAGAVLNEFFVDATPFEVELNATLGDHSETMTDEFESISAATEQAAMSRFGAGNHFPFTLRTSLESGRQLGSWVTENTLQPARIGAV